MDLNPYESPRIPEKEHPPPLPASSLPAGHFLFRGLLFLAMGISNLILLAEAPSKWSVLPLTITSLFLAAAVQSAFQWHRAR